MDSKYVVNEEIARAVLETVNKGLSRGMGNKKPGEMCVEAAVCFAYGLPHSDNPPCVGAAFRSYKIELNDGPWASNESRARGMKAIAIAQLGSKDLDQQIAAKLLAEKIIRRVLPKILRQLAGMARFAPHMPTLTKAALRCELEGTKAAADAAADAADAAMRAAAYSVADAAEDAAEDPARAAAYSAADAAADAARAAADAAVSAAVSAAGRAGGAVSVAAYSAAYSAADAWSAGSAGSATGGNKEEYLILGAEICLEVLKEMNSPGCQYLYLLSEDAPGGI